MSDNLKHIVVSAGIAVVVMAAGKVGSCSMVGAAASAAVISMAMGCIKEWCDNFDFEGEHNRWSWSDIGFDAIGTAIGTALGIALWL